jgi:hypothetical protein
MQSNVRSGPQGGQAAALPRTWRSWLSAVNLEPLPYVATFRPRRSRG